MPRLLRPLLSSLTRNHFATSQLNGCRGVNISRSSSSSSAQAETLPSFPIRSIVISPSSAVVQSNSFNGAGTSLAGDDAVPEVIPEVSSRKGRTLVLCFDGTGEEFDKDNSNIVRFFKLLKKDDLSKQMVYYQSGIGTAIGPRESEPWLSKPRMIIDAAIATELGSHVQSGYEFLMQNYTDGDRICMFGYSRGAYAARALAGMLQKVGLLPAYNHARVPHAYKWYMREDPEGLTMSEDFKKTFSVDVEVKFVGVFDTVRRAGILPRRLPFATSTSLVRVFRQALALDERRALFKVSRWGQQCRGIINSEDETDVKEVWFAGAHADVGGGSVRNEIVRSLARIPLRWMIRECFAKETGILFNSAELKELGINPGTLWPEVKTPVLPISAAGSTSGSQLDNTMIGSGRGYSTKSPKTTSAKTPADDLLSAQNEEAEDALSRIHDRLSFSNPGKFSSSKLDKLKTLMWWILDACTSPLSFGNPRVIEAQNQDSTYVHRSVQYRMQKLGYKPLASLPIKSRLKWVD